MNSKSRIKRIFSFCEPRPDAIIIKNGSEPFFDKMFFYSTGIIQGIFEDCAAILFPDGTYQLIVSPLESNIARNTTSNVFEYNNQHDFNNLPWRSR